MNHKADRGWSRQQGVQKANAKLKDKAPTSNRHERRKAAKLARRTK